MTPERWQQISNLFQTAIELAAVQRSAFLDQACADDQTLRSEVESLISSDADSWELIEKSALEVAAPLLADEQAQLTPGENIGNYEIINLLGRGGMGEVYLAKDQRLNRRVALKLLPSDYTAEKDRLRRFQQEAQAASALNHPNILTIHELVNVDGQHFIATEFVEGETLRQRAKSVRFGIREALDISIQIVGALTAAHTARIIHRDIKPENIMLRPDGYVKVLDFGLAKLTEQQEPKADGHSVDSLDASSGLLMGTVTYMSPEQTRAQPVDARSDIFSLGVVLYEMVTGYAPFAGKTANDLIHSILANEPPRLKEYLPEAPEELQFIVNKALAKNKAKRYQTAEDFLWDLELLRQQIDLETGFQGTTALGLGGRRTAGPSTFPTSAQTRGGKAVSFRLGVLTPSNVQQLVSQMVRHKLGAALGLLALVVLVGGVTYPFKKLISKPAAPFEKIKVTRLSATGAVETAVISPDGKYIGYTTLDAAGLVTLWIRGLVTNTATEIISPRETYIRQLFFSPDGTYLYYVTTGKELHRIPALGGANEKVLNDVGYFNTFSPDAGQVAFIRSDWGAGITALVIANADGKGETTVATRNAPDYFRYDSVPSWSPDGKSIACVAMNASEGYQRVFEVNIKTGEQKPLTSQEWKYPISEVAWLPDSSGILLIASNSSISSEIWRLSYPSGELQKITSDVNKYEVLSLSSDSNSLLTLQTTNNTDLWIAPNADSSRATRITPARHDGKWGLAWTPDGRIVYTSESSNNSDIWIMNDDGTNQKQLTTDIHNDVLPSITADGRYVVFESNRTGAHHIWRMDTDGGNEKQLTFGMLERSPSCSPDSKWVIYNSWDSGKATVWKTTIEGGSPVQIINTLCFFPAISPDGRLIACAPSTNQRLVFPFEGGKPIIQLELPTPDDQPTGLPVWTPDGQALTFADFHGVVVNFWNKPTDGNPPKQITNFTLDQKGAPYGVIHYAWSPDGRDLTYARYESKSDMLLISDLK